MRPVVRPSSMLPSARTSAADGLGFSRLGISDLTENLSFWMVLKTAGAAQTSQNDQFSIKSLIPNRLNPNPSAAANQHVLRRGIDQRLVSLELQLEAQAVGGEADVQFLHVAGNRGSILQPSAGHLLAIAQRHFSIFPDFCGRPDPKNQRSPAGNKNQ